MILATNIFDIDFKLFSLVEHFISKGLPFKEIRYIESILFMFIENSKIIYHDLYLYFS